MPVACHYRQQQRRSRKRSRRKRSRSRKRKTRKKRSKSRRRSSRSRKRRRSRRSRRRRSRKKSRVRRKKSSRPKRRKKSKSRRKQSRRHDGNPYSNAFLAGVNAVRENNLFQHSKRNQNAFDSTPDPISGSQSLYQRHQQAFESTPDPSSGSQSLYQRHQQAFESTPDPTRENDLFKSSRRALPVAAALARVAGPLSNKMARVAGPWANKIVPGIKNVLQNQVQNIGMGKISETLPQVGVYNPAQQTTQQPQPVFNPQQQQMPRNLLNDRLNKIASDAYMKTKTQFVH